MKWMLVLGMVVSGCVSFQHQLAGHVGCLPDEIKFESVGSGIPGFEDTRVLIVQCRGANFICTENKMRSSDQLHCAREIPEEYSQPNLNASEPEIEDFIEQLNERARKSSEI